MSAVEHALNDILVSRDARVGRPSRWPFFRTLKVGECSLVECAHEDKTDIQTKLCIAKFWYEKKLDAKFRTERSQAGVIVRRVA